MISLSMSTQEDMTPDISVCIATFRRPKELARLLDSLLRLAGLDTFTMEVIVVDNDAAETARSVSERMCSQFTCLRYCIEPKQNISHARNGAVHEARGTWVAFIDDDEVAEENWLAAYWHMRTQRPADGYFGPVLPRVEHTVPAWMDADIFFGRPRYPNGTRLHEGMRTGNAFILRALFDTHRFDPRFGLTGGEDSDLFTRLLDAGKEFYWCDAAVTFECYPPERLSLRWLFQRSFRSGCTYTLREKKRHSRCFQQMFDLIKAVVGTFGFTLMLPFELLRGRTYAARRLMRVGIQLGHLWGFCNLTYEEYKV